MQTIGERIKEVRKQHNLTQKDFSYKLYVSASYISKVEKNIETPSDMFIKLLSYEYNQDFNWIKFGYYDNEKNDNKETALEIYSTNIKALNFYITQYISNSKDILTVSKIISTLSELLDVNYLENNKYTTNFYNNILEIMELLKKIFSYIPPYSTQIKNDYHKLYLIKTTFDNNLLELNILIKKMMKAYTELNNIDLIL